MKPTDLVVGELQVILEQAGMTNRECSSWCVFVSAGATVPLPSPLADIVLGCLSAGSGTWYLSRQNETAASIQTTSGLKPQLIASVIGNAFVFLNVRVHSREQLYLISSTSGNATLTWFVPQ